MEELIQNLEELIQDIIKHSEIKPKKCNNPDCKFCKMFLKEKKERGE